MGHQVSPEKLYEAMEELNLAIQKLEDKFLQDKPFLIGPEISLADLVAIVELMQVRPPAPTADLRNSGSSKADPCQPLCLL